MVTRKAGKRAEISLLRCLTRSDTMSALRCGYTDAIPASGTASRSYLPGDGWATCAGAAAADSTFAGGSGMTIQAIR